MNKKNSITKNNLYQFFLNEIDDLYSAEVQILRELPKLIKMANSDDLKEALRDHYNETKGQVERLDRIYNILDETPQEITCQGMEGILTEGEECITECNNPIVRDVAIIAAAQKVEHYEISGYGSARSHAEILDLEEVADLLQATLDEEGEADRILTKIAEGSFFTTGVNKRALELETASSSRGSRSNRYS